MVQKLASPLFVIFGPNAINSADGQQIFSLEVMLFVLGAVFIYHN